MESPPVDRVLLLGPLQVMRNGTQVPLPPSRKARALLAYLVMAPRPVGREHLCELFGTSLMTHEASCAGVFPS